MNILVIVTADSYVRSAVMITKDLHLTEARFGFWGNFYSAIIIENLCKKYCINNKNALIFTLEKELIEKYDQIILAVGNSYVNKFFSFLYNNFQKKQIDRSLFQFLLALYLKIQTQFCVD